MKRILAIILTVTGLLLAAKSQAGTDTWNQLSGGNASGSWNTVANPPWSTGALPGATDTADFSTLDITADSAVTLDGNQSINALIFGDTVTNTAAGWVLSPGTPDTSTLTLSGTTPTITVNGLGAGKAATISASLAGTAGFTKAGAGTLTLANTNSITGNVTLAGGALLLANTNALQLSSGNVIAVQTGSTLISAAGSGGTVLYDSNVANLLHIQSGGALNLTNGINSGLLQLDTGSQYSTTNSGTTISARGLDGAIPAVQMGSVNIPLIMVLGASAATNPSTQTVKFDGTGSGASVFRFAMQNVGVTAGGTQNFIFDVAHSASAVQDLNVTGAWDLQSDNSATRIITKQGAGVLRVNDLYTHPENYDLLVNGGTFISGKTGASINNFKTVTVNSGVAQFTVGSGNGTGNGITPVTVSSTSGNSAAFGVSVSTTNYTFGYDIGSLDVTNGGTSAGLQFAFGGLTPHATIAPLTVEGNLNFWTAATITVTGSSLPVTTGDGYPLMSWYGSGPADTNGLTLALPRGASGSLSVVGSTLYLQITSIMPMRWAGGNGTWDVNNGGNLIWKDQNLASTYYQQAAGGNDSVQFDDTVGSGGVITLNTNVSPLAVAVTNSAASYTISGSGAIAGTTGLTKSGAGTVALSTVNSFTGGATVIGGTLVLTNGGALATNCPITINGGTLDLGSQNATNNLGTTTGITFGANGGNLNGTGTNYMLGNAGSYTAFTVAANASAVINENLNITNTANSGYFNLVNAGSGGMLTINGVLTALNNPSGIFLTGGGALTLNNAANNFNTIIYNSGTLITTNFATLGSYPYLAQMGQGVANGPCTFNYGGLAVSTTRSVIGNAAIINVNNNGSGLVTFTASPFNLRYGGAQTGAGQQLVFGGTSDLALTGVLQDNTPGTYSTAVVKTNSNTLTLYGNNTNSGPTTIYAGKLLGVTGGSCSNSAMTLAAATGNAAVLGVTVTNITKQWTIPSLTVNNGGIRSDLQFNFGTLTPGTTLAPLNVTGAATFTTTPTNITITGSSLPTSSGNGYPLMTWGSGGLASTNGIALTLPLRVNGSLAIVGSTLYLKVTGTTAPLAWAGGNGSWDINNSGNLIWKDNASASTYYQETASSSDTVVFNNTVGSGGVVTNNTYVSPASVTVTNPTADYTFSGSGGIAGSTGLTKSGAGKLTLTTANSFTGATTVNGGTLALTNSGALPLAAALTINGGTLDLGSQNATNNQGNNNGINFGANGGNLNGTGTYTIIGTSTAATAITVAANGNAVVNENIWATNNLANSYQNIASVGSGATLTINGQVYSHTSGNGIFFSGGGTLVLNNPSNHFSTLGVNGGTVSVTNFGALGTSGYLLMGQSTGNGPVTFIYAGPAATTSMAFQSADLTQTILNNGSGSVTFSAANFTVPYGVPVSATPQTLALGGLADINISGVIQDANNKGTNGFNTSLVKTNSNTLTLYGNNTYHGTTTVKAGTLLGVTGGSCSNSAVTLAAITGNSAALGVAVTNNTKQWTIPSLTINNGGVSSGLQFNFGSDVPGVTVAPLNVTGAATFTTTPGITVTGSSLPVSSGNGYPLMSWGSGGPANTNGMTLSLPPGIVGNLAVVGSTLYLQIPVVPVTSAPNFQSGGFSYANGTMSLTATGALGATFKLWATTNLALTPVTNTWTLLTNGTVTVSPFTITDPGAVTNKQRFYQFTAP